MMIKLKYFHPYMIKQDQKHVRVLLAYQYFSIMNDDGVYQFVPLESREIKLDQKTGEILNLQDVFVFQCGSKFMHVPLHQVIQFEGLIEKLEKMTATFIDANSQVDKADVEEVIEELEAQNIYRLINRALDDKDSDTFYHYVDLLKEPTTS